MGSRRWFILSIALIMFWCCNAGFGASSGSEYVIENGKLVRKSPFRQGSDKVDESTTNVLPDLSTAKSTAATFLLPRHEYKIDVRNNQSDSKSYFVIFYARNDTKSGHAFVGFREVNERGQDTERAFGFYPSSFNFISSPGIIKDEEVKSSDRRISHILEVRVDRSQYHAALAVKETYKYKIVKRLDDLLGSGHNTQTSTPPVWGLNKYRIFSRNCMEYAADVAREIGLDTPDPDAHLQDVTTLLEAEKAPGRFMEKLIDANKHFSGRSSRQSSSIHQDLLSAHEAASSAGKLLLVDFYGSWCPWCVKMDETLADSSVRSELTGFYYHKVKVDPFFSSSKSLTDRYQVVGIPHFIIFDENGNVSASQDGFMDPSEFISFLQSGK